MLNQRLDRADELAALRQKAIGIDLGGTNLRVAIVRRDGTVVASRSEKVALGRETQLERLRALIDELAFPEGEAVHRVAGIGIGVAGRIRRSDGYVLSAGFLELGGIPLRDIIYDRYGLPVAVDNDAHMAMTAELALGAAAGHKDAVMFTIGTGIGGAVAIDGDVHYGSGIAGQLGHLVVDSSGPRCRCGRTGCVETKSSGPVLNAIVRDVGLVEATDADALLALARSGEARAADVLRAWAAPLARAIDGVMAALDPEIIVLGGGLGSVACEALGYVPLSSEWFTRPVIAARLGDRAGMVGAALRVMPSVEPAAAQVGTSSYGA